MKGFRIFPILFLLITSMILPAYAQNQTFYNYLNSGSSNNSQFYDIINSAHAPTGASLGAEYVTTWVKNTLTSITIDLGWDTFGSGSCTPTGSYTVGVFNGASSSLTPVATFGTGTIVSLPRAGPNSGSATAARLTFTGSHLMATNEVIGVTASDSSASCSTIFAGVTFFFMGSTSVPNGNLIDFTGGCATINAVGCADSASALSASFFGNVPTTLCSQGYTGAITGASTLGVIMLILIATFLLGGGRIRKKVGQKVSAPFDFYSHGKKVDDNFMKIIIVISVAIFVAYLMLAILPATIPGANC